MQNDEISGLNLRLKQDIVRLILNYKKAQKIVLYGSRASNHFTDVSDIDIAILDETWTSRDISHIHFELDEIIRTPLKFDVVNFYSLKKEELKENILQNGRTLYDAQKG